MTSPGLKRPLDFEVPQNTNISGSSGSSVASNLTTTTNGESNVKRRCTTNFYPLAQSRIDLMGNINHNLQQVTDSPFKDLTTILDDLSENINALIKDELNTAHENHNSDSNEPPILNARQTQIICEKLIKDREQRIRDEYGRILASKLAEQYDLLTKANYMNSYVSSTSRMPTPASAISPNSNQAVAAAAAVAANHQSINALAAAFTSMQRSAAVSAAAAAAAGGPNIPVTRNPNIQDLTALAASLSGSSHPSAITSQMAYNLQHQAATAAAIQAQHQHRVSTNNNILPSGPVLLASNLDEQLATPEALFTLFGVFGDVIRVKILFNKKDNALVQMADANRAQVAQGYLDKQKVFGKVIRVTRSKHQLVQMPRDGNQSDAGLTKDFTNSQLHRFKIPGSRNYLNIYPPSNTLHISNIPAAIDEKDLHKAFKEQCGFEYLSFKFFPKDRKMALMKFNSIEHATIALIKMHNYQISEENNLRVSFSKSIMQT